MKEPRKVRVTPEVAEKWLELNTNNRRVSDARVNRWASDMQSGQWRLSNDAIVIGEDGTLYNGQHRLHAVIKAGIPQDFYVLEDAPPEMIGAIDQGRQRSVSDALKMEGSDISKRDVSWINVYATVMFGHKRGLTVPAVKALMDREASAMAWARDLFTNSKSMVQCASVVGALIYAYRTSPKGVAKFAEDLVTGEGLTKGNPALALRNFITDGSSLGTSTYRYQLIFKTLAACRASIMDQPMHTVRAGKGSMEFFKRAHQEDEA